MMHHISSPILSKIGEAAHWRTVSNEALIAVMLGILASVIAFPAYTVSSAHGEIACSFFDYGALGFGIGAVTAGTAAVITGRQGRDLLSSLLGGLALLVGAFRIAYGSGYLFSLCG